MLVDIHREAENFTFEGGNSVVTNSKIEESFLMVDIIPDILYIQTKAVMGRDDLAERSPENPLKSKSSQTEIFLEDT